MRHYNYDYIKRVGRDNPARKYMLSGKDTLEERVREAISKERDLWRAPYIFTYSYDEKKGEVVWLKDKNDRSTIREYLSSSDYSLYGYVKVRPPSQKRSNREWENFYRTFPSIAEKVATGEGNLVKGAKMRYIPMFKRILDKEWPENLKRWTEKEYEDLIKAGKIKAPEGYYTHWIKIY